MHTCSSSCPTLRQANTSSSRWLDSCRAESETINTSASDLRSAAAKSTTAELRTKCCGKRGQRVCERVHKDMGDRLCAPAEEDLGDTCARHTSHWPPPWRIASQSIRTRSADRSQTNCYRPSARDRCQLAYIYGSHSFMLTLTLVGGADSPAVLWRRV